jgi:hypothetical protein
LTPLVDFEILLPCVAVVTDELSLIVVHTVPTYLKNAFFVFGEREHAAEDKQIKLLLFV